MAGRPAGPPAGKFITFEGGEGTGKSTQTGRLAHVLESHGIRVLLTREPGGTDGGEAIRALLLAPPPGGLAPLTEALLHYAARREHVDKLIRPALARGTWIISDRFADSTMAYQGYGLGIDLDVVRRLHSLVLGSFTPDLTVVLDLAPEVGLARTRRRARGVDRYEAMGMDFHRRVREGFLAIARDEPDRCVVVDASQDEDQVGGAIAAAVAARLLFQPQGVP